jgi:hypothetical protein
MNEDPFINPC